MDIPYIVEGGLPIHKISEAEQRGYMATLTVEERGDVIAHANFPCPTPSVMPVKRLGYDARKILRIALEELERQRDGHSPSTLPEIHAEFEDELETPDEGELTNG